MGEARFTGTMVEQHLRYLRDAWGDDPVGAALATLSPDAREELVGALPVSWIRVASLHAFYTALADELDRPVAEIHGAAVDHCTRQTYGTLWRALLRITTDRAIVKRAPIFYSKTYDTGRLEASIDEPGVARCEVRGWPGVPALAIRGLRIGIANVLRAAGRKNVRTEGEPTPDGARFEIRWDT